MSKGVPQEGDIWVIGCNVYLVMRADRTTVDVLVKRFAYDTKCFLIKEFIKAGTYIGRSKTNIDSLFEISESEVENAN